MEFDIKDPEAEIQRIKLQVSQLQVELEEARNSATCSLFRLENIKDKNELVRFYTGFPDYGILLAFYEQILESGAKVMKQWDSRRCEDPGEATDVKHGPSCKLPLLEQLFLTLVRLRLGSFETDLAVRFGLSVINFTDNHNMDKSDVSQLKISLSISTMAHREEVYAEEL